MRVGQGLLAVSLLAQNAMSAVDAEEGSGDMDALFQYRSYQEMVRTMKALNASHPNLVDLFVAQDTYGLPYPPELECAEDDVGAVPCKQYVLRITNESSVDADRPEVFFSGALHGDERIGPQATMEMALLLVDYASSYSKTSPDADPAIQRSKEWLWRLVNSRAIYIVPMTNAHGYFLNQRQERGIDPNRDYNYKTDGTCMEAMTSRAINEIWRDHMFQLAITFHGGMRCVTYEWGSPNHMIGGTRSERSPDDTSQVLLGSALSQFAGTFADGSYYPTGTMNDVVYGVYGGMEDWGYAASWENQFSPPDEPIFTPCSPAQYGGYPATKTMYNNMTHRAFNILVETSDSKHPSDNSLGRRSALYGADLEVLADTPVGHVPQNVRMGLLLIDMVQPYLVWHESPRPNWRHVPTSCAPSPSRRVFDCVINATCAFPNDTTHVRVVWEVLGAFSVDETFLQVASDARFPPAHTVATAVQSGATRRNEYVVDQQPTAKRSGGPYFMECVQVSTAAPLYIRAVAKVDQNWAKQEVAAAPHTPPQSHLVNARTNDAYVMEWNGRRIQGAVYHYSEATIVVSANTTAAPPEQHSTSDTAALHTPVILVTAACLVTLVVLATWFFVRRRLRSYKRTPTSDPAEKTKSSKRKMVTVAGDENTHEDDDDVDDTRVVVDDDDSHERATNDTTIIV
ncbi:Aste57867_8709 [Aphanomyces stellatus]|uniref:Aste57867_8709 protein n=1 Tax=Aphanomyces stellatus TaxID=120398 RepID=A0A485KKY7_9STRA|nr:hypothetical protein As57867_008675 [Aphanomyces stellatus]VFT85595.1 Aste57867_8709 [Aphanomyces stellatus]